MPIGFNDPILFHRTPKTSETETYCGECGKKILTGEIFIEEHRDLNDPKECSIMVPIIFKTCVDCISLRDTFLDEWRYGGMAWDIWDMIEDIEGKIPEELITGLTPGAASSICDMLDQYYRHYENTTPAYPLQGKGVSCAGVTGKGRDRVRNLTLRLGGVYQEIPTSRTALLITGGGAELWSAKAAYCRKRGIETLPEEKGIRELENRLAAFLSIPGLMRHALE